MRIAIPVALLLLCSDSCNIATKRDQNLATNNPTEITINFHPAFDEKAILKVSEIDGERIFSVLLKNHIRLGNDEDTFYYYRRSLEPDQAKFIDSCMTETFSLQLPPRKPEVILDGIFFNIIKSAGKDSSFISSHSPDSIENKEEYSIALNTISNLKVIALDSLVINYLDDIKGYYRKQERQRNTPLIKRRELVYHVKYNR